VGDIPRNLEVEDEKFIVKPEFHITLVAVRYIAEIIDKDNAEKLQLEIVGEFYKFTEKFPLTEYEILNDIRLVTAGENKTIVAMVNVKDIEKFFEILEKKYGKTLPKQPTHITLYTLPTDTIGIPIFSHEDLQKISKPIIIPEIQSLV
jgi:hypothetical protein